MKSGRRLQRLDVAVIYAFVRPHFRDMAIHLNRLQENRSAQREMANHTIELGLLLESSRQSNTQRNSAA